jgi:xylulokinase
MPGLVGIDVGTSGVRALAITETGEVFARGERHYRLSTPRAGSSRTVPALRIADSAA